jgi:hypothetical protein
MTLEKRNSYISKSILSILHTTHILPELESPSIEYLIPSSIFIIFSLISLWAIPFYFFLTFCYYFKSGILLQDLNLLYLNPQMDTELFTKEIDRQYRQLSFHCFFSVCIYLFILLICLFFIRNREKNEILSPRSAIRKPYGACNKR